MEMERSLAELVIQRDEEAREEKGRIKDVNNDPTVQ